MGEVAGMVDVGGVGMGRDGSIEGNVFVLYALAMALVVSEDGIRLGWSLSGKSMFNGCQSHLSQHPCFIQVV